MKKWNKDVLLRSSVLVSMALALTAGAVAQDAPEETEEREEQAGEVADRITVTGSRIRRSEFTAAQPIQVIEGELSRDLGLIDASDILRQTSVVGGVQNDIGRSTVTQPAEAFTTLGSVTPSLRGLGSSVTGRTRTLFLVNGRRLGPIGVGGAPANPDVSFIPASLLQRTEVLLDGASSVYGSDALAGVVNFVLRDDFEGFEVDANYRVPELGEGANTLISATTGIRSNRGFMGFAAEFQRQEPIVNADRYGRPYLPYVNGFQANNAMCEQFILQNRTTGEISRDCNANPVLGFFAFTPFASVIHTPGESNIGIPGYSSLRLAPAAGSPYYDRAQNNATFGDRNFEPAKQYNYRAENTTFIPEQERFSLFTLGSYDLQRFGNAEVYFEAFYANRQLRQTNLFQEIFEFTPATPYNPGLGQGIAVSTMLAELEQEVDVVRGVGGIRGDVEFLNGLGSLSNWTYDFSGSFHRSTGVQRRRGFAAVDRMNLALNGVPDGGGGFECGIAPAPAPNGFGSAPTGCVVPNFFAPDILLTGRFDNDVWNDYLFPWATQNTEVEQIIYSGFATGDLFSNPYAGGDAIQAVFGAEYRIDSVRTVSDPITSVSGFSGNDGDLGANGGRSLYEFFAELAIPLISGQPGIERLRLELATRYTDEENFGNYQTYQVRGEYAPVDWIAFSAGYGTSFRAPDTGEAFGTGIDFIRNTRIDPCVVPTTAIGADPNDTSADPVRIYRADLDTREQVVIDNCIAVGADPFTLGTRDLGTTNVGLQNYGVSFSNRGNRDVGPETSEAIYAKITFDQPWFDGFDLRASLNYYEYEVQGQIGQLQAGTILSECYQSPGLTSDLCAFQGRSSVAPFELLFVNEASINLGSVTSRGLDINVFFETEFDNVPLVNDFLFQDGVRYSFDLRATRSFENAEDILGNGNLVDNLGEFGFPELQASFTNSLFWGDWGVFHRLRYIGEQYSGLNLQGNSAATSACSTLPPDGTRPANQTCQNLTEPGRYYQHDITVVYNRDTWTLRAGVLNVADNVVTTSATTGGSGNHPRGLGFDPYGRQFYVNIVKRF